MTYTLLLTAGAERDLAEIYDYITEFDSIERANHVFDRLGDVMSKLREFPERGACPRELQALGIRDYRQVFFKPYRVFYRIANDRVHVYLIADGRRDMQSLLARRLLAG